MAQKWYYGSNKVAFNMKHELEHVSWTSAFRLIEEASCSHRKIMEAALWWELLCQMGSGLPLAFTTAFFFHSADATRFFKDWSDDSLLFHHRFPQHWDLVETPKVQWTNSLSWLELCDLVIYPTHQKIGNIVATERCSAGVEKPKVRCTSSGKSLASESKWLLLLLWTNRKQ